MNLQSLFLAVKEENLDKWQLENYHKEMSELYAQMHLEMGNVKKKRALFMVGKPEETNAAMERAWRGSADGLREIELKAMIRATSTQLQSLKSRMYNNY